MIHFEVLGKVRGKGRPRFQRLGNFVKTYTDKDTVNYESLIRFSFIESGCKPYDSEAQLKAVVKIYIAPPKSTSKKKLQQMLEGKIRPTKKPDIDNVLKSLFDGLNKVAYNDDTQIISIQCEKYYSLCEKLAVDIYDIEEITSL